VAAARLAAARGRRPGRVRQVASVDRRAVLDRHPGRPRVGYRGRRGDARAARPRAVAAGALHRAAGRRGQSWSPDPARLRVALGETPVNRGRLPIEAGRIAPAETGRSVPARAGVLGVRCCGCRGATGLGCLVRARRLEPVQRPPRCAAAVRIGRGSSNGDGMGLDRRTSAARTGHVAITPRAAQVTCTVPVAAVRGSVARIRWAFMGTLFMPLRYRGWGTGMDAGATEPTAGAVPGSIRTGWTMATRRTGGTTGRTARTW
jgi:hypothetical protein